MKAKITIFNIVLSIIFICISMCTNNIYAQSDDNELNSITGKTFVFSIPPVLTSSDNKDEVVLTIISQSEVTVKVTARYGFFKILSLVPFEKGTVIMPAYTAFPYQKTGKDNPVSEGIYDAAIRIEATEPITVTAAVKNDCGGEGFAVLPIESLGLKYTISSFNDASRFYDDMNSLPSIVTITANYDNTHVSFLLGGNNDTKTAGGLSVNNETSIVLAQGDVWVISTDGENSDLTGSVIQASLPVSVVTANQCANIPVDNGPCNYIAEMEIPSNTFGKKFLIPAFPDRKFSPVLRIVAAEDNTTINVVGEQESRKIITNGGVINSGYIELRINEPNSAKPGIITADKPISITLYNSGVEEDGDEYDISIAEAAPFQMLLIPQEQALSSYLFAVPEVEGEKLFDKNIMCLIIETEDNEFPSGFKFGEFNGVSWHWGAPGIIKKGETILFKNDVDGKVYAMAFYDINTLSTCQIVYDKPFALYLYGQSRGAGAYGTIAGMGLKDLESNDTLPPQPTWNMLCGGNVIGKIEDKPDNKENRSNLILPVFYTQKSYNYDKEFEPIISGVTQSANWKLFVRNPNEDAQAVIKFSDKAGNDTVITINYYAAMIAATPNIINLGVVKLNDSIKKDVIIKNYSKTDFFVKKINFKKYPELFQVSSDIDNVILPNEEINIQIQFTALKKGIFKDTLIISDSCSNFNIVIIEVAVDNSIIYAQDVEFDEALIGTSKEIECQVENRGDCDLELYNVILPVNTEFLVSLPAIFTNENPLVLKPGENMKFKISFKPVGNIQYTDSVVFISDAFGIDSVTVINGTGVQPGLVAESYNWEDVRIYRSDFPVDPIPVNNEHGGIRLFNKSNFEIKIDSVSIIDEDNSINGFIIDELVLNSLEGKTLLPQQEYIIPVDFLPMELKNYRITICYTSNLGYNSFSVLRGRGVLPNYQANDAEFDTLLINNWDYPVLRKLIINNLSNNVINNHSWDFPDTLHIYGVVSDDQSVGINSYSKNGFKLEFDEQIFPLTIYPGESYSFDCYFVPSKIGLHEGNLHFITDAVEDKLIKFSGYGTGKKIIGQSNKLLLCKGEIGTINCLIKNNGFEEVILNNFYIPNSNSIFFIKDDIDSIRLKPNEVIRIDINVVPKSLGEYQTYLKFNVNYNDYTLLDSIELFAASELTSNFTSVSLSHDKIKIGEDLWYKVSLDENEGLEKYNIDSINVQLHYNSDMLLPQLENIQLEDFLSGKFFVYDTKIDLYNKNIDIIIKSITGDVLSTAGELFSLPFTTLFPLKGDKTVTISNNINTNYACIAFVPSDVVIELEELCAYELRRIMFSSTPYDCKVKNNIPIIDEDIELEFSIGFDKAGTTCINIYSLDGSLIGSYINDKLESGLYNLNINTDFLSAGSYYIIFSSGNYKKQLSFIIL